MEENAQSTTSRTNEEQNEENKNEKIEKDEETKKDEEIITLFNKIDKNSKDPLTLVNDLLNFNYELKSLKDITLFLTFDNLKILKDLSSKENIKINLILSKIYMNIINNESLYSKYLVLLENEDKSNLIIQFIEDCISLIEKLNGFVFDPELFKFKNKTLSLIKCIYLNCKSIIKNSIYIKKLEDLLSELPAKFFSETFNELNQDKELFKVGKSQDQDKISNFEDKFAQINNYYEQFETFKKFVELNFEATKYDSVAGAENPQIDDEQNNAVFDPNKIDFYQQYGLLLLKFCKYHQYIFLNKKPDENENKEKKENEEDNENIRVVFLLDKIKQDEDEDEPKENGEKKEEETKEEEKKEEEKKEEKPKEGETKEGETKEGETKEGETKKEEENKKKGNKKIENIMNEKLFVSVTESKEYNELIKKELNYFIEYTKSIENDPKMKTIIEQMKYYLGIIDVESYVPLYLTDFSKITISDNFTPSFLTNVPAGKTNEFYLETKMNETMLVYIEFSLEDKSKDITFEVNKYELNTNSFKSIFKEEKIEDSFKFFILCNGYSLYQIIFNNYYSWFTSKDVNYRIALLKLIDKPKKANTIDEESKNEEKVEEVKEETKNEEKVEEVKEVKEETKKEEKVEEKEEVKEEPKKEEPKKEEVEEKNFNCNIDGENFSFNKDEICQRIKELNEKKDEKEINIPLILYLNNITIININKDEIKLIRKTEEEEYISQSSFTYNLMQYIKKTLNIKKPADAKDKKITISIFSQNRDLSALFEDPKSLLTETEISKEEKKKYINYIKKIGFYLKNELGGYNVEFKLYDLCEQSLVYHLFNQKQNPKKPVLFLQFDKFVVNGAIYQDGEICLSNDKFKLSNIKKNEKELIEFIGKVNDSFKGIDLVLSSVDNDGENKKIIDEIKKSCKDAVVYEQNDLVNKVFNYMNLFYDN